MLCVCVCVCVCCLGVADEDEVVETKGETKSSGGETKSSGASAGPAKVRTPGAEQSAVCVEMFGPSCALSRVMAFAS
jgi:hypothetical protein